MEGKKKFTCHLEVEEGQYPEYCVQDVCCGVYKQKSWFSTVVCLLLVSLIIVVLTCYLIYLWITYVEGDKNNTQTRSEQRRQPLQDEKIKPKNVGKEEHGNDKIGKMSEHETDEVEDESDEEKDEDENKTSPPQISQDLVKKDESQDLDGGNDDSHSQGSTRDVPTTSNDNANNQTSADRELPIGSQESSSTKHGSKNTPRNIGNDNIKITYIKEEFILPDENKKENNSNNDENSVKYYNLNYQRHSSEDKDDNLREGMTLGDNIPNEKFNRSGSKNSLTVLNKSSNDEFSFEPNDTSSIQQDLPDDLESKNITKGGLDDELVAGHVTNDGLDDELEAGHVTKDGLDDELEAEHVTKEGLDDELEAGHVTKDGLDDELEAGNVTKEGLDDELEAGHVTKEGLDDELETGHVSNQISNDNEYSRLSKNESSKESVIEKKDYDHNTPNIERSNDEEYTKRDSRVDKKS
ncbi:uncharacterized protein DDB_G0290685-like [Macrosteles quadrilineatus]|uniref:uncharacterized protein DDB_G0290685-like n=1 Tax=Macrosteles quadrilineatus TaxID=74068 RepID=UPI0023E2AE02|nr:uncharacterized protein DDB_G0290685-like [Macrosteles quadrilineatus]